MEVVNSAQLCDHLCTRDRLPTVIPRPLVFNMGYLYVQRYKAQFH